MGRGWRSVPVIDELAGQPIKVDGTGRVQDEGDPRVAGQGERAQGAAADLGKRRGRDHRELDLRLAQEPVVDDKKEKAERQLV